VCACSVVSSVNPLAEPMDSIRRSASPSSPSLHADAAEAFEEGGMGTGDDVSRWYRALSMHDARRSVQRTAGESEAGSDRHTHDPYANLRVSLHPDPARADMGSQWKARSLLAACSVVGGAAVHTTVVAMAGCTQAFSSCSTHDSDRRLPPGLSACPLC
jgi:hypothetical protein